MERPSRQPATSATSPAPTPWLRLAQLAWLALVLSVAGFYALGVIRELRAPPAICPTDLLGCTEAAAAAALRPIGLTTAQAVSLVRALSGIGVPVGCLLMAGFIFWRRPDRPIALALSAMLALYGGWVNTGLVDQALAAIGLGRLGSVYDGVFLLLLLYAIYTFPTGQFVPRWAWAPAAIGLGLHILAWLPRAGAVFISDLTPLLMAVITLGLGSQAYRFRRAATAAERQQLKWVLAGLSLFFLNALLYFMVVVPAFERGMSGLATLLAFVPVNFVLVLAFPATLVVASLRYRLWDIDVIIRRTLVYSLLTALLTLAYFGLVLVLQALVGRAGRSALATVLSTLAIAALFAPLRRRVQGFVDRRFYRQKYDAGRALAGFAARARDEVDLDRLIAELRAVVDETMQPAHVSLWLKRA
jgi:hypothetical protein